MFRAQRERRRFLANVARRPSVDTVRVRGGSPRPARSLPFTFLISFHADFDTVDPVDSGFARRQAYGPSPRHVYISIMLVELDRTRLCACATSLHTFA